MALTKGTNSYVTVAEADAYFTDRLEVSAWDAAVDLTKQKALITATAALDEMSWTGYAISDSQPLAFPRIGEYFDPRLGVMVYLDETVPDRILKATFELALHLLNNEGVLTSSSSVTDLSVGPIQLTSIRQASAVPSSVRRIAAPLLANQGSTTWWRAN